MGDFNSRVGNKNDTNTNVIGKHGEPICNSNGTRMIDYCVMNDLIIANTFYEHANIHKFTRVAESRNEKSILDYVLVQRSNRRTVTDVRVQRSAEIFSDHYLVIAKIKKTTSLPFKKAKEGNMQNRNDSVKTYKLREEETANRYQDGGEDGRAILDNKRGEAGMSVESYPVFHLHRGSGRSYERAAVRRSGHRKM
ncbi:hypothetical protein RI129_003714 [Pyrocoelia pectoralis]|uniref:Endonuclease/exonuclease/phosphatase domain-containing protein n=1 Tax=Pyrocoelia pectoralis TaxID=417401 RepID=A0AAN7VID9_9COLE